VISEFRVFAVKVETEFDDGAKLEVKMGCNGVKHAQASQRIWRDRWGRVKQVKDWDSSITGRCDNNCGQKTLGFFKYPVR